MLSWKCFTETKPNLYPQLYIPKVKLLVQAEAAVFVLTAIHGKTHIYTRLMHQHHALDTKIILFASLYNNPLTLHTVRTCLLIHHGVCWWCRAIRQIKSLLIHKTTPKPPTCLIIRYINGSCVRKHTNYFYCKSFRYRPFLNIKRKATNVRQIYTRLEEITPNCLCTRKLNIIIELTNRLLYYTKIIILIRVDTRILGSHQSQI